MNVAQEIKKIASDLKAYGRMVHKREFYRPNSDYYEDIEEYEVPRDVDLEIWTYRSKDTGELMGVAFQGRAQKPLWNHFFNSEGQRNRYIEKTIEMRREKLESKRKRREERKQYRHDYDVGDFIYSSWGYDQTNVNFYQVIDVTDKSVVIREVASKIVKSQPPQDYVVPVRNKFINKKMVKRVSPGGGVRISSSQYGSKWDGKPKYETSSGWGH